MTPLAESSSLRAWPHAGRVTGTLLGCDIRQGLRKHFAGNNWRSRLLQASGMLFGLAFLAGLHFAAWGVQVYAAETPSDDPLLLMTGLSTALWSFLLFVMLSGGLMRALVVLHEQDDSALLLSSPASPRAILAARLFGNALQSCLVDGFIIVPWIDVQVFVFGQWQDLWGFAVWFAIAVIVTCVDGLFSFGLIRWFGLRRARIFSQAIPFVLIFGVTFFAGSMSLSMARMNLGVAHAHMPPELQARFVELARTPLALLARAAGGDATDLFALGAGALALMMATLRLTERAFIEGTQNVTENADGNATSGADGPFRAGAFRLEIRKSLRLVLRTPMIAVQCLAQVLTPVGVAFVLGRDDPARAVAFFTVFAAGVLSGMVTIAAGTVEECDDLLAMSPRSYRGFRLAKIGGGFLFPCALALLVGSGLFLVERPLEACAVILGGIPLGVASALVGETFATPVRPGQRPKLLADPIMMIPLLGMQIVSGLVAGLTVFAAAVSDWAELGALVVTYIVLAMAVALAQLRKPLV